MLPTADYDIHPAFSSFCRREQSTDGFVGMNDISDDIVNEFVITGSRQFGLLEDNMNSYDSVLTKDTQIDLRLHDVIRRSFREAQMMLVADKCARSNLLTSASGGQSVQSESAALYKQGFFVRNIPEEIVTRISFLYEAEVDKLRSKAASGIDTINYAFPEIPEVENLLNGYFIDSGLYEALSTYYGRLFDSFYFVLHRSDPDEKWLRVFDDVGLSPAKTLSMHFDAAFEVPKAMLYLNDVSRENGAFSLVPRKQPFENVEFDLAFGKCLLKGLPEVAKNEFEWILRGNESVFRCPPMRELFATLPHSLRRTCNIGDHLLDDTPISQALLAEEIVLEGPAGLLPVFVGSHTLHRGGLVKSGERIALQINFSPKPAEVEAPQTRPSLWRRVRGRLRS